jgi:hypothetical protein
MHIRHSEHSENSNIHALQIYNIPTNSINVISHLYIHTWCSEPLGSSYITSTPSTCHFMKSTQRHYSVAHTYMTFRTFGEFMYYIHSKYMSSHKMQCKLVEYHYTYVFCPIPENICLLIRLAWNHFPNHATYHYAMHTLVLFSSFFARKAITPGLVSDARSYNFLDLHLLCLHGYNLETCSAFMIYYASAPTLYVLCVHTISHANHLISYSFHKLLSKHA